MTGGEQQQTDRSSEQLSWPRIKARTLEALDAMIAYRAESVTLKAVANVPVELPARSKLLAVQTVKPPRGGWNGQTFFVVDADAARGRKPPMHEIHLMYPPQGQRVVGEVTPAIRRAMGTATHVRMMYSDDIDLSLLRMLRASLQEATRGPLLPDLWSTEGLPPFADVAGLNREQSAAFAAFTKGGAWLVWGPPGTGKTTVIVKAVTDALAHGRSVLIASNTHVAVDNVVKDLADVVNEPGQVVRVGDQHKIDQEVADHDWLMLDRAAATLTNRATRLQEIADKLRANDEHEDRKALITLSDRLADPGLDVDAIVRAYHARAQAVDAAGHHAIADELTRQSDQLAAEAALLRQRADECAPDPELLVSLLLAEQRLSTRQRALAAQRDSCEASVRSALDRCQGLQEDVDALIAERATWSGRLPWRAAELQQQLVSALDRRERATRLAAQESARLDQLNIELATIDAATPGAAAAAESARTADRRAQRLRENADDRERRSRDDATAARAARSAAERAQAEADTVPDHEFIIATAEREGIAEQIAERDRLNQVVTTLDRELKELENEKRKLDDEYANTRRELLESAPVIACTLTALTMKPELANRRYDTVIVDEAASAHIPHLVHAGSKADRCLAFVGDFLQNSPITDIDDARTQQQRELLPWQRDDIFALHGITHRAGAERHPRCVALRTQFRYPPIIAGIVNDFCYDGLLETRWHGTLDGPVVTFIDTAGHPDRGLHRYGTSWTHPLGLRLLDILHEHRDTTGTLGLVCPYSAHAQKAELHVQANGYDIACGTSHRFQGRQFDTVIVDLMQDDQPRWVAAADLSGGQRQVSAAKLLNVAITRAKRRLFLIGDWGFVRSSQAPGMRALANLRHSDEFDLARATEILPPTS
ncbi:DEAD/DEAH box helicase [Nocardia sp. NPDC050412]|uniref:DEAD/DEAH box helicase n=1 Tax=Nocardia sp. NPDC050412 TaxID=3364320 RepID=UPI0037989165